MAIAIAIYHNGFKSSPQNIADRLFAIDVGGSALHSFFQDQYHVSQESLDVSNTSKFNRDRWIEKMTDESIESVCAEMYESDNKSAYLEVECAGKINSIGEEEERSWKYAIYLVLGEEMVDRSGLNNLLVEIQDVCSELDLVIGYSITKSNVCEANSYITGVQSSELTDEKNEQVGHIFCGLSGLGKELPLEWSHLFITELASRNVSNLDVKKDNVSVIS